MTRRLFWSISYSQNIISRHEDLEWSFEISDRYIEVEFHPVATNPITSVNCGPKLKSNVFEIAKNGI